MIRLRQIRIELAHAPSFARAMVLFFMAVIFGLLVYAVYLARAWPRRARRAGGLLRGLVFDPADPAATLLDAPRALACCAGLAGKLHAWRASVNPRSMTLAAPVREADAGRPRRAAPRTRQGEAGCARGAGCLSGESPTSGACSAALGSAGKRGPSAGCIRLSARS